MPGTAVTLEAAPSSGKTFQQWSGDVPAADQKKNPVTITHGRKQERDRALRGRLLHLDARTSARARAASFRSHPRPTARRTRTKYTHGTKRQLDGQSGVRIQVQQLERRRDRLDSPVTVSMTANKSVTADFTACFALTTLGSPAGSGSVSRDPAPNCQGGGANMYNPGTFGQPDCGAGARLRVQQLDRSGFQRNRESHHGDAGRGEDGDG